MKTCCRCERTLDFSCFVKSPKYKDGHTQPCKDCRKEKQDARLAANLFCIMCKVEPHMKGNFYCRTCLRIINDLPIERERPNVDRNNKTMCCECKINPRRKGGHYCVECANKMQREWSKLNQREYLSRGNNMLKRKARVAVWCAVQRGDLIKTPCEICQKINVQAHHYMGYAKEFWLVVQWLCFDHHLQAERAIKKSLTSPS